MDLNFWLASAATGLVLGLPISMLANYLTPKLGRWWSNRSQAAQRRRETMVKWIVESDSIRQGCYAEELRTRHRGTQALVLAAALITMDCFVLVSHDQQLAGRWSAVIFAGLAMLMMVFYIRAGMQALELESWLADAQRILFEAEHRPQPKSPSGSPSRTP